MSRRGDPLTELKQATAGRVLQALTHHPDPLARRWKNRDLARAVAEESGVAVGDDSAKSWLDGSQPRDPRVAAALARVLRVSAGWLYFGEGEAPSDYSGFTPARGGIPLADYVAEQDAAQRAAKRRKAT